MRPGEYVSSKNVFPARALLPVARQVALAVVLGAVYGYAAYYSPIVYLTPLLACAVGFFIGEGLGAALRETRARGVVVASLLGLVLGGLATYAAWVTWILAASHHEVFALARPEIIPRTFAATRKYVLIPFGWEVTLGHDQNQGAAVIEALAIAGPAISRSVSAVRISAFCEPCGSWTHTLDVGPSYAPVSSPTVLRGELEAGNATSLEALLATQPSRTEWTDLKLEFCPTCDQLHLLTVTNVDFSSGQRRAKHVVQRIQVSPVLFERLKLLGDHKGAP